MKIASAKAKGRRLQNAMASAIRAWLELDESDVKPAIMGEGGLDQHLSAAARRRFPYATECKNVERLNLWDAIKQAEANAAGTGLEPLVVFTRNRAKTYAVISLEHLLDVRRELAGLDPMPTLD